MPCPFCMIAKHKLPATVIYENKTVIAFLDKNPVSQYHTLIVPKTHYKDIYEIDNDSLKDISVTAKKIASAYKKTLKIKAVNLLNASGKAAQQSVFHFHLHLVPRRENDGLDLWFESKSRAGKTPGIDPIVLDKLKAELKNKQ